MAARVPPGFRFALKVPKSASHGDDLSELPPFAAAAEALSDQLLGLVVQFAEGFRNTQPNRDRLARIRDSLAGFPLAAEFRHVSWDVPGLPKWLAARDLTCVSVGVPDLPTLFPSGLRAFGGVYCRLHGRNPDAWYAGGAARYDYDYTPAEIRTWADALVEAAAGAREAFVFFNNCVGIQAVENARKLADELRGRPGVRVMDPPERPRGRTLFDEV